MISISSVGIAFELEKIRKKPKLHMQGITLERIETMILIANISFIEMLMKMFSASECNLCTVARGTTSIYGIKIMKMSNRRL